MESDVVDFLKEKLVIFTYQQCDFFPLFRYEVNFQDGIDCGGAYIKLLADTDDLNLV